MVGPSTQFTVRQTLTSPSNVTGVTPGTPVVTSSGGAGATLISGPTPASATVGPAGTTFTWVYQSTASTGIGQVQFGISATNGSTTWPSATSNSVIVVPNLTFRVTINSVPGVDGISNTASIQTGESSGPLAIPLKNSNTVQTGLTGSIGDLVFADNNGNGTHDVGEPGLAGVKVNVTSGATTKTATTDGSGAYRVYGLNANAGAPWNVAIDLTTLPTDWVMTSSPTLQRTLATNSTRIDDADFGAFTPAPPATAAEIRGTVWTDRDEDGVIESEEAPLEDIAVNLYLDRNTNGLLDAADLLVRCVETDVNGLYIMPRLNSGAYLVDVLENTIPAGMNYVSGGSAVRPVTLTALQISTGKNFGFNHTGSIGDLVYYDTDNDRTKDAGESGIPNVRVSVYADENSNSAVDADEVEVGIAFTDASGIYTVQNLPAGSYVVRVDEQHVPAPVGSPNAGLYNTMLPTNGEEIAVTLATAQELTTADFGFAELALVAGYVFHDANYSGIRDSAETSLANISVVINGNTTGGSPISMTASTDASGEYEFLVPAGSYLVGFNPSDPDFPAGMTQTTTAAGHTVSLQGGWELEDMNFGRAYAGTLGGIVFADTNGNGTRDGGEAGIPGVVVECFDSTGTIFRDSRICGPDGSYRFDGQANGTHVLKVRPDSLANLSGATITADPVAPLDGIASSTITSGSQNLNLNFGYNASSIPPVSSGCLAPRGQTLGMQYMVTRIGRDILGALGLYQSDSIMSISPNGLYVSGVRFGAIARGYVMQVSTSSYSDIPKITATNPYAIGMDVNDDGNTVGFERRSAGKNVTLIPFIYTRAANTTQRLITPFDANVAMTGEPVSITNDNLYAFGTVDPDGPGTTVSQGGYWSLSDRQWTAIAGLRQVIDASSDGSILLVVNSSGQGQILRGNVSSGWPTVLVTFTGKLKFGKVSASGRYVGSAETLSGKPTPFVYDTLNATRSNLPITAADSLGGIVGALSDTGRVVGSMYRSGTTGSTSVLWESATASYTTLQNVLLNDGHTQQDASYAAWNLYNGGDGMSSDGLTFAVFGKNPSDQEDSLLFQTIPPPGDRLCVGNAVWLDADADGIKEVGEPGIAGAVVRLYHAGEDGLIGGTGDNADWEYMPSITTTSTGSYVFSPVAAGKYYITVQPPRTMTTTRVNPPDLELSPTAPSSLSRQAPSP
jgi:uncharacterized protein (DUF2141 family)